MQASVTGSSLSSTAEIRVSLGDIDEAPIFSEDSYSFSIPENIVGPTSAVRIGPFIAIDPERNNLSYTLLDADGGPYSGSYFEIRTGENMIQITPYADFDFELQPMYTLHVQASAAGSSLSSMVEVYINLNDLDEPPVFSAASYSFNIPEQQSPLEVGPIIATDPEDIAVSYTLLTIEETPYVDRLFELSSNTQGLHLSPTAPLDFESGSPYIFKVKAYTSVSSPSSTVLLVLSVDDIDEPPIFSSANYHFNIAENVASDSLLTSNPILATDPEGASVSYNLLEADGSPYSGSVFEISLGTQEFRLSPNAVLDFEATSSYNLKVEARTTGSTQLSTAEVSISVINIDEPPVFSEPSYNIYLAEDQLLVVCFNLLSLF